MPAYTIVDNIDSPLGHVNMPSCNCKHSLYVGKDLNGNRIMYNPLKHSIKECYMVNCNNLKPATTKVGTPNCRALHNLASLSQNDREASCNQYYDSRLMVQCKDSSSNLPILYIPCTSKNGAHCEPTPPPMPIPPTPAPTPSICDNLNPIRKKGSSDNLECSNETKNCNNFFDMSGFICKNGTKTCRQGETKIPNKCIYKGWDQLCRDGNPLGLEKCPKCASPAGLGDCSGCIHYYCKQGYMSCCDVSIVSYCKDASFLSNCTYPNGAIPSKNLCTSNKDCENGYKCTLCPPTPKPSPITSYN